MRTTTQFAESPQRILLPAKAGFIATTMGAALILNLFQWASVTGLPDWVALLLVFWCVHEPRKMGLGIAWLLGLMMDASNGALLGQYAFAYSVLAFASISLSRRILWFSLRAQSLHVLVLLAATQLLMLAVRVIAGGSFPGMLYFAGSVVGAILWPVATFLLLLPQRRPESVDETRPI
jgi:rod shape-determining protein MreD